MSTVNFRLPQGSIRKSEFLLFQQYVAQSCGIHVPPEKAYLFETRLSKMMLDVGIDSFGAFYDYIVAQPDPSMRQKIVNAITTNETQWFRDETPWRVLEEVLLPKLVDRIASGRKAQIRIWSAAASTGQEIYSTVMCVDTYLRQNRVKGVALSDFDFFATDISNRVLDVAKKGRYDRISIMRGLSDDYRGRYFAQNSSSWDIDPRIRDAVRFAHFNLQNAYQVWGKFDVIFCRYVLIYFSDALKQEVIMKMRDALAAGGTLFTGNYALYGLFSNDFDANHYGNLTYYAKKEACV